MKNKARTVVYILLAVVILFLIFLLLKPKQDQQAPQVSSTTEASVSATPEAAIKTFELIIKGKKLTSGPSSFQVNQGDEVTFKITSDEEEEFHVHAYDVSVELVPGKQATLTFSANMSGRFPFELEKSQIELGALEVQPK